MDRDEISSERKLTHKEKEQRHKDDCWLEDHGVLYDKHFPG